MKVWEVKVQRNREEEMTEGDPTFEMPDDFIPLSLQSCVVAMNKPVSERTYFYLLTYMTPLEPVTPC